MIINILLFNIIGAFLLYLFNGMVGGQKAKRKDIFQYSSFGFDDIREKNFSENFFHMIVHPPIVLVIFASILQACRLEDVARNLWLVIPLYWMLRFINIVINNTARFLNWHLQLKALIFSVLLGEGVLFGVIQPLLDKDLSIFIDLEQFRDAFWFAAFTYVVKLVWDASKREMTGENVFPAFKKANEITRRYIKFHNKYDEYVNNAINKHCQFEANEHRRHFECVVYSIMIYETHNRPAWIRIAEYIVKLFCWKKEMSLGIMQVQTKKIISNKRSIELSIKKLYEAFSAAHIDRKIDDAIWDYNVGNTYHQQVISIYLELCNHLSLTPLNC